MAYGSAGESDSYRADVCDSARAVYDLLAWEEDGETGISDMTKEALEEAAEADSDFEGLTRGRVPGICRGLSLFYASINDTWETT